MLHVGKRRVAQTHAFVARMVWDHWQHGLFPRLSGDAYMHQGTYNVELRGNFGAPWRKNFEYYYRYM